VLGSNLSGGQRKQLAFARAILKNTRILILDEPTSGLDPQSAQVVVRSIDQLAKRKTVIVIAHHLATIENAHRIFVLQKGELSESGSHKQLMKKTEGLYSQLQQYVIRSIFIINGNRFSQLASTMRNVGWEDNNRSFESTMTSYAEMNRTMSATNLNLRVQQALTTQPTSDTEEEDETPVEPRSAYETEQEDD
jgi:ABC-type multidrug transport system ATPase subunit